MAFVSASKKKSKGNLPDNQLIIKVKTSKGFVTLGRVGLYDESALHAKVANLPAEKLAKLLGNAQVEVVPYEEALTEEIELII